MKWAVVSSADIRHNGHALNVSAYIGRSVDVIDRELTTLYAQIKGLRTREQNLLRELAEERRRQKESPCQIPQAKVGSLPVA